MPITPTRPTKLTLDELRALMDELGMKPRQKILVESLIASNGDRIWSVQAAYKFKNAEFARTNSYHLLANPKVVTCLSAYYGRNKTDDRAELIVLTREQLKAAEPGSVAAQRLLSQLNSLLLGGKSEATDEPETVAGEAPQKFQVGDVVLQEGVLYRVTDVDADGKIISAEEAKA